MIAIIPTRGGSKEVRRKNVQVVQGKPLLCHVADTLQSAGHQVWVSTEDTEIKSIALVHGYNVVDRPIELSEDSVTVDEVARHAIQYINASAVGDFTVGPFIVAQPTCPRITAGTLHRMEHALQSHQAVTCITPNMHILRKKDQMLTERWNRQHLSDITQEVGVRMFRSEDALGVAPKGTVMLEEWEALDIDTQADMWEARHEPKTIGVLARKDHWIGTGHHHRALLLESALQHHNVIHGHDYADLVILDVLDTTTEQVTGYKTQGMKVVTFEDRGPGARHADLVINALYPRGDLPNEVSGPDWADLRPEFVGLPEYDIRFPGSKVLLMFGGSDPSQLGEKTAKALVNHDVTWVEAGADEPVAYLMMTHDVLVTSAGRTVYEAAAVGIPTVVLAQNQREQTHVHLGATHGNRYLGHGRFVSADDIRDSVEILLRDKRLRQDMSRTARASVDGRGVERIRHRIDGLLEHLL